MGAGLVTHLVAATGAPCGEPGAIERCAYWNACKRHELACAAFREFVLGNRVLVRRRKPQAPNPPPRIPSRVIYNDLYHEQEHDHVA